MEGGGRVCRGRGGHLCCPAGEVARRGVVVQDAWLQAEVERYCEQWVLKSLEDQLEVWHEFWLIKAESDSEQEYSERVMAQLAHLRGRREKAEQEVMLSSEAGASISVV